MSLEAGVAVAPTSEVGECCSAAASPIPTRHALSPLRDGTLFGALFAGSARVRPRSPTLQGEGTTERPVE